MVAYRVVGSQRMVDPSIQAVSDAVLTEDVLEMFWLATAPVNVLVQSLAVVKLRGALRAFAVILAVTTGAALALVAVAYLFDPGNLWELLLRMSMPPTLVVALGLMLLGVLLRPRTRVRYVRASSPAW